MTFIILTNVIRFVLKAQATASNVQVQHQRAIAQSGAPPVYGAATAGPSSQAVSTLYPSLSDYMGITPEMLEQATAVAIAHQPSAKVISRTICNHVFK